MSNFTVTQDNNQINITMPREFSFNCYEAFCEIYKSLPGDKAFTLDFSCTHFIDSSALGMLLQLREHTGGDKQKVILSNPNETVNTLFRVAKFDKLFTVS